MDVHEKSAQLTRLLVHVLCERDALETEIDELRGEVSG